MWRNVQYCCRNSVSLSVRASVCQMHVLWQNKLMQCGYFDTIRNGNHSSFLTPTVPKVINPFEKRRFRNINVFCAEKKTKTSYRLPHIWYGWLITTADNCTMNFSDVGTAHHISRTVFLIPMIPSKECWCPRVGKVQAITNSRPLCLSIAVVFVLTSFYRASRY